MLGGGCVCGQDDLARLIVIPYFSESIGNYRRKKSSWLLRNLETRLKNDFIGCKGKKGFIVD